MEYARLLERRSRVVSMLRDVETQLRRQGCEPRPSSPIAKAEEVTKEADLMINGVFSWRGVEVCRRLFETFDADGDGVLSVTEVANYRDYLGIPEEEGVAWTFSDFLRHRLKIKRDLEKDALQVVSLSSKRWERVKKIFAKNKMPATEFQYICGACGCALSSRDSTYTLRLLRARAFVNASLRKDYKRRHTFGFHETSKVDADDVDFVYRETFLAWFFSGAATKKDLYAASVLSLRRWLRRLVSNTRTFMGLLGDIVDRGRLLKERLAALATERADLDVDIRVLASDKNDDDSDLDDGGLVAEGSLTYLTDLSNQSKDASVIVDFQVRKNIADKNDLKRLVKVATKLLQEDFDPELKRLFPKYAGLKVLFKDKIIRVLLTFQDKGPSLDGMLSRVLGVPLSTLITPKVSFRSALSLSDLLLRRGFCAGKDLALQLRLKGTYAHASLAMTFEELLEDAAEDEATLTQDQERKKRANDLAKARNSEKIGIEELPTEKSDVTEEAADRALKQARRTWLRRMLRYLRSTKAAHLNFTFSSLSELLFENAAIGALLPADWRRTLEPLLKEAGGLAAWWARYSNCLADDMALLRSAVDRPEKRKEPNFETTTARKLPDEEKRRFVDDMRRLTKNNNGKNAKKDPSSPSKEESFVDMLRRLDGNHAATLREGLDVLALASELLVGPKAIALQSGRLLLKLDLEGCDIFHALPKSSP